MKVYYDEEVDALYLKLGDQKPDGAIEIAILNKGIFFTRLKE